MFLETSHPLDAYLSRLSPGSERTIRQSLNQIAKIASSGNQDALQFPWQNLRYSHTTYIRSELIKRYAPSTVNKMLPALRSILKECFNLGLISSDDYLRAIAVKNVRGSQAIRGREISDPEIQALLATCAGDRFIDVRDKAILTILLGTGLRRFELVALDLEDVDLETGEIRIRAGKGRKDREVFLCDSAVEIVQQWLQIRGDQPGPLIIRSKNWKGRNPRLNEQLVYDRVVARASSAKIPHASPHDFRRSLVSKMFDLGIDGATIQGILGHSKFDTTVKYDRRGKSAKKKAAEKLGQLQRDQ